MLCKSNAVTCPDCVDAATVTIDAKATTRSLSLTMIRFAFQCIADYDNVVILVNRMSILNDTVLFNRFG